MAGFLQGKPKEQKSAGQNAYVSHKVEGNKLIITLDVSKVRESEKGNEFLYVGFDHNGTRISGNLFSK